MKPDKSKKAKSIAQPVKESELRVYLNYVRSHKKELYIFICFHVVVAILLRYCYPNADVTPDSGGYINQIYQNFIYGSTRPLGYSYFIYFINSIGSGTIMLFIAQYLIHCISTFFFYSSTCYLFNISTNWLRYSYLAVSVVFITGIYATNMVMSDSLFTSLTVILLTICLWLVYTRSKLLIIPLAIVLLWIISVRYIALIYPLFFIPVLLVAYSKKIVPVVASGIILIMIFGYTQKVKTGTERDQRVEVFSAFAGWQIASNAIHIIPHIDLSQALVTSDDIAIRRIDSLVRLSYKVNNYLYPDEKSVSYDFIWVDSLPLRMAFNYFKNTAIGETSYYSEWNKAGKAFNTYGNMLIKEYPKEFFKYYLLNNAVRTFHPPAEFFEGYADTTYSIVITKWFNWSDDKKMAPRHDILRPFLVKSPYFYSVYWVLFVVSIGYFMYCLLAGKISRKQLYLKMLVLVAGFVLVYTAGSIYGAPVNLRFLLPLRLPIVLIVVLMINDFVNRRRNVGAVA